MNIHFSSLNFRINWKLRQRKQVVAVTCLFLVVSVEWGSWLPYWSQRQAKDLVVELPCQCRPGDCPVRKLRFEDFATPSHITDSDSPQGAVDRLAPRDLNESRPQLHPPPVTVHCHHWGLWWVVKCRLLNWSPEDCDLTRKADHRWCKVQMRLFVWVLVLA